MTSFDVALASNLLDIKLDQQQQRENNDGGNLRVSGAELKTGIKSIDRYVPPRVWRPGRTIGIAGMTGENSQNNINNDQSFANGTNESAIELISELLATHLLNLSTNEETKSEQRQTTPSVFLLTPPSSGLISQLYEKLLQRSRRTEAQRTGYSEDVHKVDKITGTEGKGKGTGGEGGRGGKLPTEDKALSLLDQVSVLQYLDLIGLSESLSEVSSRLSTFNNNNDGKPTSSSTLISTSSILYIEGLPNVLGRIVMQMGSASRISQTAALMTNILRSIRSLSRNTPELLVLLELEAELSRPDSSTTDGGHAALYSAFGNATGSFVTLTLTSTSTSTSTSESEYSRKEFGGNRYTTTTFRGNAPIFTAMACANLARIIQGYVDAVVVVHDGFRSQESKQDEQERNDNDNGLGKINVVVEIVKDSFHGSGLAEATALGSWAVWEN